MSGRVAGPQPNGNNCRNYRISQSAQERSHSHGLTLIQFMNMVPDEAAAHKLSESVRWPDGNAACPRCNGTNAYEGTHKTMPYRCRTCNRTYCVKSGTAIESSRVSLQNWAIAIYLEAASLKGASSMKLHRDLGVTQRTAWFMLHRIRESTLSEYGTPLEALADYDEIYVDISEKAKHASKKLHGGRGAVGNVIAAGHRDRATMGHIVVDVAEHTDRNTLQGFLTDNSATGVEGYSARNFNEIMVTPFANLRYGGKTLIELVRKLLGPKEPLK